MGLFTYLILKFKIWTIGFDFENFQLKQRSRFKLVQRGFLKNSERISAPLVRNEAELLNVGYFPIQSLSLEQCCEMYTTFSRYL